MKNKILFMFSVFFICFFSGCEIQIEKNFSEFNFKALEFVELCDYKTLKIRGNFDDLSEEELNSIIMMHLSTHNQFIPVMERRNIFDDDIVKMSLILMDGNKTILDVDNYFYTMGSMEYSEEFERELKECEIGKSKEFPICFSEKFDNEVVAGKEIKFIVKAIEIDRFVNMEDAEYICKYYKCSNMDEVYKKVKKEAFEEFIFVDIYEQIYNKSNIKKIPTELIKYVKEVLKREEKLSYKEKRDYEQELIAFAEELLLLKAITEREGIFFDRIDYEEECKKLAQENNLTIEDIKNGLDYYSVYYYMMQSEVFERITSLYK